MFDSSHQSGQADQSQQTGLFGRGALKRHDTKGTFLKDADIGFAEINSARIIRGISNIHACNPILVVYPNAIIYPKKA